MATHIRVLVLVAFALIAWATFLCWVIAKLSGWNELATFYANETPFEAREWKLTSVGLRRWKLLRSNLTLWIGADRQYLYLRTWPFNLPGFRQLHVPWEDVSCREFRSLFWKLYGLRFRAEPGIEIQITRKAMERVVASAGGRWADGQPQFPV
jgi:hypothetical protein